MTLIHEMRSPANTGVQLDRTADVYELFASPDGDDYLGCFDTIQEATTYAKRHAKEV